MMMVMMMVMVIMMVMSSGRSTNLLSRLDLYSFTHNYSRWLLVMIDTNADVNTNKMIKIQTDRNADEMIKIEMSIDIMTMILLCI